MNTSDRSVPFSRGGVTLRSTSVVILLGTFSAFSMLAAQNPAAPDSARATPPVPTVDYPLDQAGILIADSDWISIEAEAPAKVRLKHGLAPALTYGIAPASAVSSYTGTHAAVHVEPVRPVICVCHIISMPATPSLVRLHPKKDARELHGGKLHIGFHAIYDAFDIVFVAELPGAVCIARIGRFGAFVANLHIIDACRCCGLIDGTHEVVIELPVVH
jgi:hypothetical protein